MKHGEKPRLVPDTSDDPLIALVKLLARQAARERPSAASEDILSTDPGEDKKYEA
jgi:hypothetical protein